MTARISIASLRGEGISVPSLSAAEAICTTLTISPAAIELPTLVSVERIVAHLAAYALVPRTPAELERIALLVNQRFLSKPPEAWTDAQLQLDVARLADEIRVAAGDPTSPDAIARMSLQVVSDVRVPVLASAESVIARGQRIEPDSLVNQIGRAVDRKKSLWKRFGPHIQRAVATTVLATLVDQLVGIPLGSIVRLALNNGFGVSA